MAENDQNDSNLDPPLERVETGTSSGSRRSRVRSIRSWSTRSRSRPRSPDSHLHQIYSAGFHDDHGTYADHDLDMHRTETDRNVSAMDLESQVTPSTSPTSPEKEDEEGKEEVESQHSGDLEEPIGGDVDTGQAREDVDLEKAEPPLSRRSTARSTKSRKDPNMVSWEGPDDTENPKNWALKRKWTAVFVVSSFTFISPVASSMVAPALPKMAQDLGVHSEVESQMMLSIFLLAYAFGPLFLGPLSELYGRVPVLQLANLFFLIFNLVCGFAQNGAEMLVFRFLSGIGGSAPLAIGGGILADCFQPEQRGKAIAIYSLAPLIGPAAGPIAGGFITQNTTWRWAFWAVSIADAVIQVFGLFFLQETWAPKLLEQKAKKLRKETGNEELYAEFTNNLPLTQKLGTSLERPFKLLFTQPIIIALALCKLHHHCQKKVETSANKSYRHGLPLRPSLPSNLLLQHALHLTSILQRTR